MSVFSASTSSRVRLPSVWRTAICSVRYRCSFTSFTPERAVTTFDDFVHRRDVHPDGDLIPRQDLLPGHLDRLPAHLEHLDARRRDRVPEAVRTGSQFADQAAVDVHEPALALVDRGEGRARLAAQARQRGQQPLGHLGLVRARRSART